jgi:hypothetical protein
LVSVAIFVRPVGRLSLAAVPESATSLR